MEEKEESSLIIKSGNVNKSIGEYVDKICKELIKNLFILIKAYDKNMNKLITIEQIIRRELDKNNEKELNDAKIKYEIGKEKKIPFIKCEIKINKEDIKNIEKLIGNKNNKRNNHPFSKNEGIENMEIDENNKNKKIKIEDKDEEKEEDKINNLCIENIHDFFND